MKKAIVLIALASTPAVAQPGADEPAVDPNVEPANSTDAISAPTPDPTPVAVPATAEPEDSDDIDLGALGLDPNAPVFDDKLQIYGFADFAWGRAQFSSPLVTPFQSFAVGNVNLYVRKNLSARVRALTEVRLLFAPNGSSTIGGVDGEIQSTAVGDATNLERPISWGGISIERAHVEYDLAPWLTIRAGHFLTPYGIWNTDHGSPAIIGTGRPYIVGEHFFPEHQTGLELFGAKSYGDYRFEYHATVSNGRNLFEATRDPDRLPAFGGRLALSAPLGGTLKTGVSVYRGRASETTSTTDSGTSYDEVAVGADAAWDHGGFHIQGEVLAQQRRYVENHRAARVVGFAPDGIAFGSYVLAGYRSSTLWNVMPYVIVEDYHPFDPAWFGHVTGETLGLNFRPIPSLVLKVQGSFVQFNDGGLLTGTAKLLHTQVAWVF